MSERGQESKIVAHFFSQRALSWKEAYNNSLYDKKSFYEQTLRKRRLMIKEHITQMNCENMFVLDAGCGPGYLSFDLLENGHKVVCLDMAHGMVHTARETIQEKFRTFSNILQASVEALPFDKEIFDLLLNIAVVQYLPSDEKPFAEFFRTIKQKGTLLIVLPNKRKLHHFFDPFSFVRLIFNLFPGLRFSGKEEAITMRPYRSEQLPGLFTKYGFTLKSMTGVDYGPLTILGKTFLPFSASIAFDALVTRLAQYRLFNWLNRYANQWILIAVKE